MRKISAGQEALHIIYPTLTSTALGAVLAWTLQSNDIDVNAATLAGTGATIGLALAMARQMGWRLPQYKRKFNYAYVAELITELRDDDKQLSEVGFMFDGLDLPVTLPEETLLDFCKIAAHRQRVAYFGNKSWVDSFGGVNRPTRQMVLSSKYYCNNCEPKFYAVEVEACKKVLQYTGQLTNWRQGVAGDLVRFYSAVERVEKAKRLWPALLRGHQSISRKN